MGWTRRQWLALMAASRSLAAEGDVLVPDPILRRPALLDGEAFVEDGESNVLPAIRAWDMNLRGGARVDATTESAGDGVAAHYRFAPGGAGRIVHERTKVGEEERTWFAGLSFWVKGDGSTEPGLVTFGDHEVQASAPFDLSSRDWKKVFVPWERFEPGLRGEMRHLGFSVRKAGVARSFVVDRLRLYSTASTERIEPTPLVEAPGNLPAEAFLSGREHVSRTLGLLRARRPATLLFTGDSVTAGAQLYYTAEPESDLLDWERKWSTGHLFGLRAGAAIAQRYGYRATARFERWDFRAAEWVRVLDQGAQGEGPVARTLVYGAGGQESSFAVAHAAELLAPKPNVVVYQFAGNDLYNKRSLDDFGRRLTAFVDASRTDGSEVALYTPPPMLSFSDYRVFTEGEAWADFVRSFAAENGCALLDARGAFLARGLHHAGDLYSDFAHPNHRGHRMLARLAEELLAPAGLTIWDDLP